jgi:hypothetical protein
MKKIIFSENFQLLDPAYRISKYEANDQGSDERHNVGRTIRNAHHGASMIWSQVDVIDLEA